MIHRFPAFKLLPDCILGVDASAGSTHIGGIYRWWVNMYCNYSELSVQQGRYGCCVDMCIKRYDVQRLLSILVTLLRMSHATVESNDSHAACRNV